MGRGCGTWGPRSPPEVPLRLWGLSSVAFRISITYPALLVAIYRKLPHTWWVKTVGLKCSLMRL